MHSCYCWLYLHIYIRTRAHVRVCCHTFLQDFSSNKNKLNQSNQFPTTKMWINVTSLRCVSVYCHFSFQSFVLLFWFWNGMLAFFPLSLNCVVITQAHTHTHLATIEPNFSKSIVLICILRILFDVFVRVNQRVFRNFQF